MDNKSLGKKMIKENLQSGEEHSVDQIVKALTWIASQVAGVPTSR